MFQTFKELVQNWNAAHGERAKLQHAYLTVSLAGILFAGLVALIDGHTSDIILRICFAGLGIFLVNAVAWALLYGLVLDKLPTRKTRK